MVVEMIDEMHGDFRLIEALPFLQAAASGGKRILRVKRQKDEFLEWQSFESSDCFGSIRMPVAHGHNRARGDVRAQGRLESPRLLLRKAADGRSAADFGVVLAHGLRAACGNQFCQGFTREKCAGEI